jgi:hypothetical protein
LDVRAEEGRVLFKVSKKQFLELVDVKNVD